MIIYPYKNEIYLLFKYFTMTKYKSNLFYPIVHVGNIHSVDLYIETMRYIEIWIKDIYELDNKKKLGSKLIYIIFLKRYFLCFFFKYFII